MTGRINDAGLIEDDSPVYVAALTDGGDIDNLLLIVDGVKDAMVAGTDTVFGPALQLLRAGLARIAGERANLLANTLDDIIRYCFELFDGRAAKW